METFSLQHLLRLTDPGAATHCVSLYMPTHAAGLSANEDPVRLKNLLDRAESLLVEHGLRSAVARETVHHARELSADVTFWNSRQQGLALFLTPSAIRTFWLPESFKECVFVHRHFLLKPLLPLLGSDLRFLLLTLSQQRVRLFEGTRAGLHEVSVAGLPGGLAESLNERTDDRGSQVHSGAKQGGRKQSGVFHGHGGEAETAKDALGRYLRLVDSALQPQLRDEHAPLVVAAVEMLAAMYQSLATYPHVLKPIVGGNPDHLSEHELHAQAWPLVAPQLAQEREAAVARYRRLAGTGRTSDDVRVILPAAAQGRIETLFVDSVGHCWGRFTGDGPVELHDSQATADEELLDRAAVKTLQARGSVHVLPSRDMPTSSPLAAVFRFGA